MDWAEPVVELLTSLFTDQGNAESLVNLLGEPVEKGDECWRIHPAKEYSGIVREAFLYFEDSSPGRDAVTRIELDLAQPWRISPRVLGDNFGCEPRRIPVEPAMLKPGVSHPPRPRTFACDIRRANKIAVVMFTGRPVNADKTSEIDVLEIIIARTR